VRPVLDVCRPGPRGATVWLTGLPAAGKTTLSAALERALLERGNLAYRLDGDVIRRELCSDLGFDRESRAENVRRVAHVARILADAGLIAIVSLVSPYAQDRQRARDLHVDRGLTFIEVYLDTPIELCISRDPKGLYAQAQRGEIAGLTGAGGAYEPPPRPDVRLTPGPVEASVERVCGALAGAGLIRPEESRFKPAPPTVGEL
jgi:adenylyl-sulfate kinase